MGKNRFTRNLKAYKKIHGLSKAKTRNLNRELRRLNRAAEKMRYLETTKPPVPIPIPREKDMAQVIEAWKAFSTYINSLPIYYIACHGATCTSYAQCRAEGRNMDVATYPYPSFKLPDNTFMINPVNGEICLVNMFTEREFFRSKQEYKNTLLVDSPNESTQFYNPEHEYPTISGIHRSGPGSIYPNYKCSFSIDRFRMGVFDLSKVEYDADGWPQATMIYYPTEEERSKSMFIEDVIRKIYENPENKPGIFILGACSGPYFYDSESMKANDYATTLVRNNELEYTSKYPTLSQRQIKSFEPEFSIVDAGSGIPRGVAPPAVLASVALAHGELPSTLNPQGTHFMNQATSIHANWRRKLKNLRSKTTS